MSVPAGSGTGPSTAEHRGRRWLPFWVIQATEFGVAVVLADVSIHVSHGGVLIAGALLFFALAITADGPLGLARVCSQRLHLVLVIVASVLLGVASLLPGLRPDIEGLIVVGFAAVGLIRLATLTQSGPVAVGARPNRWARAGATVIDTTATVADPSAPTAAAPTGARTAPGPRPGGTGSAATPGAASTDAAARWAGRATGSVAATGKKASARYGPVAGAHLKRTIRAAGRAVGSATAPSTEPKEPTE